MTNIPLISKSLESIMESNSLFENRRFQTTRTSVIDNLLFEIYDKWSYKCKQDSSWDSDTFTSASDAVGGISWRKFSGISYTGSEGEQKQFTPLSESVLNQKGEDELRKLRDTLKQNISILSSILVRQLKKRDHSLAKMQKNCDILTAILQASSLKRREDTKLKFVMEPKPGNEAFRQWCEAMRGVARLPLGLPSEIRRKVWLSLANHHITVQKYDWNRVIKFAFNEKSNPDDDALGMQIVKDLHRTGCDKFESESERAILKRVLLAYARWNKRVGYCQGFNVLAAIILEVMERNEEDSLKVMVYLVDHILPESYFAQNLQALSIDIAVFRELLNIYVPKLAVHLNHLQSKSQKQNCYGNDRHYEPPLTNVFTMQWFLTLFATCLPPDLVLRIWDSIMLEGSEIILRTGLVLWEFLADRLLKVKDADSFYCTMRDLTSQLSDGKVVQSERLVNRIYNMAPIPFPDLTMLRDRFTYNINPFSSFATGVVSYGSTGSESIEEEADEDDDSKLKHNQSHSLGCFSAIIPSANSNLRLKENQLPLSLSSVDISQVGPGAVSSGPSVQQILSPGATQERMTTNLTALEVQYNRIKDKQKRTRLLINNLGPEGISKKSEVVTPTKTPNKSRALDRSISDSSSIVMSATYPSPQNSVVNHLFLTRSVTCHSRERPVLTRQKHVKTSLSDASSITSSKNFSLDLKNHPMNAFHFNSFPVLESTASSIRPSSDSSSIPRIRRYLSESDITTSGDGIFTPKARSVSASDIFGRQLTLLELSKLSQQQQQELLKIPVDNDCSQQLLPTPDLNSLLEKHHKRIQSNITPVKSPKVNQIQLKVLPIDDKLSNEIGNTARWVAEHHLQSNFTVDPTVLDQSHICIRQSAPSVTSNRTGCHSSFGTKAGLCKTMAKNRVTRSKENSILRSVYLSQLQRYENRQLVQ